jgi:ribosomal protein S1
MAHALKFTTVVSGKTLTHADLGEFSGKRVEVIVVEDEPKETSVVVSLGDAHRQRRFGTLAGKLEIADDFDSPLPNDLQRCFDGEADE